MPPPGIADARRRPQGDRDHLGDEDEDEDVETIEDEGYLDYSQLSKREIQELIDDALDQGDFEMVSILQKYM